MVKDMFCRSVLSSADQRFILSGFLFQLRPSATVYDLARNFNLEMSMFERLVKMGLPFVRLNYQVCISTFGHLFQLHFAVFAEKCSNFNSVSLQYLVNSLISKCNSHDVGQRKVMHFVSQHRMRPEIARLLTPHIYEQLENHPSVYDYDNIKVRLPPWFQF